MKRQYLGDSKDSFKWDYLHFLTEKLGYHHLNIIWMMTADDNRSDGKTPPERYPARPEILNFCKSLKTMRDPMVLTGLPAVTGAAYKLTLYKSNDNLTNANRASYFSDVTIGCDQVLFLDPDNGFEPERSFSEKHVRYSDIESLLRTVTPASIITVFQHHRRKRFSDDFTHIQKRLLLGNSTAICWHSLMFVNISLSEEAVHRVRKVNREYANSRPDAQLALLD